METMNKFDPAIKALAQTYTTTNIIKNYKETIQTFAGFWPLSRKFTTEEKIILDILENGTGNLTPSERMMALRILQTPYHNSGKIEGCHSCDSSAHGCDFCGKMRELAKTNPLIICKYCYDWALEEERSNVGPRHALNLLILKTIEFTEAELASLPINGILRGNSAGDTDNLTQAMNQLKIAVTHPRVDCALWAKNTAPISKAVDIYGKPENLRLIQSSPVIGTVAKLAKHFDNTFTVYPTKESTIAAINAGANPCNGKKCAVCGYKCYRSIKEGGWEKGTNIAEYLRIKDKAVRAAIVAAYEAKCRKAA